MKTIAQLKPIVFLLGPSGSGKSQLAEWVAEDLRFLHLEIDRWPEGDGIDLEGLRKEWDAFYFSVQASHLAATVRDRVGNAGKDGAILSFPGNLVLSIQHVEAAEKQGIQMVILYGTRVECLDAFLRRERELQRGLDETFWNSNNARTYAEFGRPEHSKYWLMAFEQSRHRDRADLVTEVRARLGKSTTSS